jgi:hypothetical protein
LAARVIGRDRFFDEKVDMTVKMMLMVTERRSWPVYPIPGVPILMDAFLTHF